MQLALHKGLEQSNTFLYASDNFFAGANHQASFSLGAILARSTQWRQGSDGNQPIAYRVSWTRPVDHASCAEESDGSFPRPTCNLRLSYDWASLAIARLATSLSWVGIMSGHIVTTMSTSPFYLSCWTGVVTTKPVLHTHLTHHRLCLPLSQSNRSKGRTLEVKDAF